MDRSIDRFIRDNRQNIKRDIMRLVDLKSVKGPACPGAPYGKDVRECQLEAMRMLRSAGMEVTDLDGRIAFGDWGPEDRFLGIIGHIDVVPEGSGWTGDPYRCEERDGFLVGRGASDNKGPFIVSLYAVRYLIENRIPLRYGIRFFIGSDEESGMSDIDYYLERCPAPVFTFTPDYHFPVGNGEKGIFCGDLRSPSVASGSVRSLKAGVVTNAVADRAEAVLDASLYDRIREAVRDPGRFRLSVSGDDLRIEAIGRAAHAAMPENGINAIWLLSDLLLRSGVLSREETPCFEFIRKVSGSFDGSVFGIDKEDGIFRPTTVIAGMLRKEGDRYLLNVNCRYNTAFSSREIAQRIRKTAEENGFTSEPDMNDPCYYLSPEHPAVKALCDVYDEVRGVRLSPIVLDGGTYARRLPNAVSYGATLHDARKPEWAGNGHMKDEAYDFEKCLTACEVYIRALLRLQKLDL